MQNPLAISMAGALWLATLGAAPPSFAYDAYAPLDYEVESSASDGGVTTSAVSFRSGDGFIHATLVMPEKPGGAMPGALFVHWLGDAATSNHTEFLADAQWLARRGVISLLPDEPWSQPDWFEHIRTSRNDAADSIAVVVALRRCLDVLLKTPGVDARKIAYVGHDFGAMYGALLAGVDARPSFFVFMAPTVTLAQWFLLDTARAPPDRAGYVTTMNAFDIPGALSRASFSASLVQFAEHDQYVSPANARAFTDAVPALGRTVHTYDTDHALRLDVASDDRRTWLARQFAVAQP